VVACITCGLFNVRQSLLPKTKQIIVALAAILFFVRVGLDAQAVTQPALRAAFLYNFAKFTEWPSDSLPAGPLTLCVIDDSAVEGALSELVGNSTINGRAVTISKNASGSRLRACHLLYVGEATSGRAAGILDELLGAPVLTVSNGDDFIRLGGIVGLFVEEGRMRFAINQDAAQRAGVRLSSRLLQLARIVKDDRHDKP
jgi:hypothetical protein